jgi:hypothetical protein
MPRINGVSKHKTGLMDFIWSKATTVFITAKGEAVEHTLNTEQCDAFILSHTGGDVELQVYVSFSEGVEMHDFGRYDDLDEAKKAAVDFIKFIELKQEK